LIGIFGSVIIGVCILTALLLLLGWAVYRVIGMWIQDKLISGLELIIILGVILGLMDMSLVLPVPLAALALVLLALLLFFIPFVPRVSQAVRLRQMIARDIAQYQAALERRPEVPYPHRKLGEICERHEDWEGAIEHYQAYVEMHEAAPDVRHRLERCLAARRRRDMGLRLCPACGTENPREYLRCQECGFYLKGLREIADVLIEPDMLRVWKWLIAVFLVPAVLIGLLGQVIPPVVSLIMLAGSVIATIVFLYGRARRERERRGAAFTDASWYERLIASLPDQGTEVDETKAHP